MAWSFYKASFRDDNLSVIPRWVSARCNRSHTRILESLMIFNQIIIKPVPNPLYYTAYPTKMRSRLFTAKSIIGLITGSNRYNATSVTPNPMVSMRYITFCSGSGATA